VLTALPGRIIGLLENDLLQALPLYVFMGALLNRLPLADRLFRCGVALGTRSGGAPAMATLGLGALLAPMNGSVGASVAMLARNVAPKLAARDVPAAESTALVCVASTLGVVIPPSLVLILLGDAMMRAHTEAAHATGSFARIVNTQDIFHGALLPAALFLLFGLCVTWATGRRAAARGPAERPAAGEWATAIATAVFVIGLLTGVAAGYFYAVEAAAMGGVALLLYGGLSGGLRAVCPFRRRQRLRARRFRDRLCHRADRHAGLADARTRRRLDLGSGPARSASEFPSSINRLCSDDGPQRHCPKLDDQSSGPCAGTLSRRAAPGPGFGRGPAAARSSRPAGGRR
jgi:Tripartite ATP-independent periplasmic transporter, DctM component